MATTGKLGGEVGSRGLFSGRGGRGATVAWVCWSVSSIVLFNLSGSWQVLLLVILAAAAIVLLTRGGRHGDHTIARNLVDRRRWRYMRRHGFDDFIPVDWRSGTVAKRSREWRAYRDWADGVDGMYWLVEEPGRAAIAYHYPPSRELYFSTAFSVDGALVGLPSDASLEQAQNQFADLLAGWGSRHQLVTGIQVTTRMLPPDTARHESWMLDGLDPGTSQEQLTEYSSVLTEVSGSGFVPRHFVTIRWDQTPIFDQLALSYGPGQAGQIQALEAEIASAHGRLETAGYTRVRALSGPQIAAVIRHLQHPDWWIEQAFDVTPDTMYLPSHSTRDHVETTSLSPRDPEEATTWLHRTAQFALSGIETRPRDGKWMSALLTGLGAQIIHTVSIQHTLVPAQDAKDQAYLDATGDQAELISQKRKGKLAKDETEVALTAVQQRLADLTSGTGHHGDDWSGFVTISVPAGQSLALATSIIEEAASTCGIGRLDWFDSWQAAAQSLTWPVARGGRRTAQKRSYQLVDWLTRLSAGRVRREKGEAGEVVVAFRERRGPNIHRAKLMRTSPQPSAAPSSTWQARILNPALIGSPGSDEGIVIGRDKTSGAAVYHDVFTAYNNGLVTSPNVVILGALGKAKSALVKTVYLWRQLMLLGRRAVVLDKKPRGSRGDGEYGELAERYGAEPYRFIPGSDESTCLNPLDPLILGGITKAGQTRLLGTMAELGGTGPLNSVEYDVLSVAHRMLLEQTEGSRTPVIPDLLKLFPTVVDSEAYKGYTGISNRAARDAIAVAALNVETRLRRLLANDLSGMFDRETSRSIRLHPKLTVFNISNLPEVGPATAMVMAMVNALLIGILRRNQDGWLTTLVMEEAWNLMAVARELQDNEKLARALGVSNLGIMHHLADVPVGSPGEALVKEAQTVHLFGQDQDPDIDACIHTFGLDTTEETADLLRGLPRGEHLLKIGNTRPVHVIGRLGANEALMTNTDGSLRTRQRPSGLLEIMR